MDKFIKELKLRDIKKAFGKLDPKIVAAIRGRIKFITGLENSAKFADEIRQLQEVLDQCGWSTQEADKKDGEGDISPYVSTSKWPREEPDSSEGYLWNTLMKYFPDDCTYDWYRMIEFLQYHLEWFLEGAGEMFYHRGVYDLWVIISAATYLSKYEFAGWWFSDISYADYVVEGDALSH